MFEYFDKTFFKFATGFFFIIFTSIVLFAYANAREEAKQEKETKLCCIFPSE